MCMLCLEQSCKQCKPVIVEKVENISPKKLAPSNKPAHNSIKDVIKHIGVIR